MKKFLKFLIPPLLLRHYFYEKEYRDNLNWKDLEFVLRNLRNGSYRALDQSSLYREAEHQIARFKGIDIVLSDARRNAISGELVEFGTWQGLGLLIFDYFSKNLERKFVGVDSFEGLPHSSTIWSKGVFSDTGIDQVEMRLSENFINIKEFELIKGWFDEPHVLDRLKRAVRSPRIFHFDADLGSSTSTALRLSEKFIAENKGTFYLLFDDWGCHQSEVPDAFYSWLSVSQENLQIDVEKIFSSNLVRYFRITVS